MGAVCPVCDDDDDLIGRTGDDEDIPLTGRWVSGRGLVHVVGLQTIQWQSGDVTTYRKVRRRKGCYKYVVKSNGSEQSAVLTPEGHLQWNDGDLWKRDANGPQTGTYVALAGALAPAGEMLKTATSFVVGGSPGAGSSKSQADSPNSTVAPSPSPGRDSSSSIGSPFAVREASTSPVVAKNLFGTPMAGFPEHSMMGNRYPISHVSTQYASPPTSRVSTQFSSQLQSQISGPMQTAVQMDTVPLLPATNPSLGPMPAAAQMSSVPTPPGTNPSLGVVPRPKRRLAPQACAPVPIIASPMPDR